MIWNVVYTISMGKHGNQRVPMLVRGTLQQLNDHLSAISRKTDNALIMDYETRKAFQVKNILLIEWSEVKK
jgi:hypothetical protein